MSFSLTNSPWIQCELIHGDLREISLREVFAQAPHIRRLAGESAPQDYAVLRLLLVMFWRAVRHDERLSGFNAERAEEWWLDQYRDADAPQWQGAVSRYLDEHEDRFDLLHPDHPFMQVADLHTAKGEHSGLGKLVPDAESDYFSMRAGSGLDTIGLAEAARWLVHLQAWNYSGIKSGAVGDDRVKGGKAYPIGTGWTGKTGGVVLHGRNLAETLILNTPATSVFTADQADDLPAWERAPDTAAGRGTEMPAGPCDLLTWQIRRVRLFTEGDRVTGVLVSNGDRVELRNQFADPMTAYRYSKNQSKAGQVVHFPRTHDESRTLWRGIQPLLARAGFEEGPAETTGKQPATVAWLHSLEDPALAEDLPADREVSIELVGMIYGPQDATITGTLHEVMPLRMEVLYASDPSTAHLIVTAAQSTMEASVALGQFAGTLQQAAGGTYEFQADPRERILSTLNQPFKNWLGSVRTTRSDQEQRGAWYSRVRKALTVQAQELVRSAGLRALIGREDQNGRLVSAATAWSSLMYSLDKHLGKESAAPGEQTQASGIGDTVNARKAAL